MARIAIEMPRLGYDMETGIVSGWLKKVGDSIARGEAIAEIETDKSTVEMEATASGTLAEIVHDAGAEVAVGEPIAWLDEA
jgi:pyruvate/2-oxoglutarate dehydrogenase complex dihydrolipoamide acyltransferase (E2) component